METNSKKKKAGRGTAKGKGGRGRTMKVTEEPSSSIPDQIPSSTILNNATIGPPVVTFPQAQAPSPLLLAQTLAPLSSQSQTQSLSTLQTLTESRNKSVANRKVGTLTRTPTITSPITTTSMEIPVTGVMPVPHISSLPPPPLVPASTSTTAPTTALTGMKSISTSSSTSVPRLTIRPRPDLTLGGVPKREFLPHVPITASSVPIHSVKKEKDEKDKEKHQHQIPDDKFEFSVLEGALDQISSKERQGKHQKQGIKKRVSFGPTTTSEIRSTSTSSAASPFASGPPTADKNATSISSSDIEYSLDQSEGKMKKKKKHLEINQLDPFHPTQLPLPSLSFDIDSKLKQEQKIDLSKLSDSSMNHIKEDFGSSPNLFAENNLLFIQLPALLPVDNHNVPLSQPQSQTQTDESKPDFVNTLQTIPEGQLGKLQVFKSGKMKLQIGNCVYSIESGVNKSGFLQQVVALHTPIPTSTSTLTPASTSSAESTATNVNHRCYHLGDLSNRIICVPDIDSMLSHDL